MVRRRNEEEDPEVGGEDDEESSSEDGSEDLGDDGDDDDEDDDNPMLHLPGYVVKRVEKLKDISTSRDSIMEQYMIERAALEHKFADMVKPMYDERRAIISGEQDDAIAKATGVDVPGGGDEQVLPGVPHFWVTCMSNHETAGEIITEQDVDCLESLQDIVCVDDANGKGFALQFIFGPNEYFSDTILTKRYEVPNLLLSDEPMIKSVQGCTINWKDDELCLTHRQFQKKQRGKGKKAGQVRTVTKKEKKESFFHWFEPPKMPNNSDVENMDEEEVEQIEELFSDDFEIAQAFRCEIITNAAVWYTGEASEQLMLELLGDGGEIEGSTNNE
mmetsp:Transcript_8773/g.11647  ORF Transcript_8773/g.11647 Transcript_8773/m.11647 type:complete len:331 (+) Transcript_8773:119-1111(+)|eukprot:CAMPEP_0198142082 /NCGR_PEP_ID=MMETSP1443-20131203/4973_1 /TAXON_ID=186043 /ORGANISM="Entomoneis sp., Strain CCMP2396" /LENGTH=330 /DNA_ID=CAMNT_0043805029 /DNA_START=91 /DNA_END=1083 /DNA_ORIENTATION=+